MKRPAAALADSEDELPQWQFEFAIAHADTTQLPPLPRGNPNNQRYALAMGRRQTVFNDLKVLDEWMPLTRNVEGPHRQCPYAYMQAIANGQFDCLGLTGPEYEWTSGTLRFRPNDHLYKFVGDSVSPGQWQLNSVQYACFQDKTRTNPQPLVIVRNVVATTVASSTDVVIPNKRGPSRDGGNDQGGDKQADAAGSASAAGSCITVVFSS